MKPSPSLRHILIFYIVTVVILTGLSYVVIYDSIQHSRRQKTVEFYEVLHNTIQEKIARQDLNFTRFLTQRLDRDVSYRVMLIMPSSQPYLYQFKRSDQPDLTFFTLPYWHNHDKTFNYEIRNNQLLGYSQFKDGYEAYIQAYYPPFTIKMSHFIYWLPLFIGSVLLLIGFYIARRYLFTWRILIDYANRFPRHFNQPYQPLQFHGELNGQEFLQLGNILNRMNYQLHNGHRRMRMLLSRLERIIDYSPLPLLLIKRSGQISFFNKCFEQAFMTAFEDSVKYYLSDFLMGFDKSTQLILNKLDSQRTSNVLNVTNLERNLHYQLHLTPWFGKQGQVQGFSAILNDVSDFTQIIQKSQFEIGQQQERLNEFDKLWSELGHELRTPLSGILGMLELMEQDNFTPEQQETYMTVEQTSKTMLVMLNDMLDVAKMEAGKLQVITERTDILLLCQQVSDLMSGNARRQHIELLCFFDPQCPRYFTTDPGRLRQALMNLLSNAIKFTQSGYVALTVSYYHVRDEVLQAMLSQSGRQTQVSHIKNWLCFNIKDTGIGIAEQDMQKLFSHFNQANESISRQFGGTGLGLAISNNFAHLLGGFIHVDSKENQGSTFSLCLPSSDISYQPVYQFNTDLSGLFLIAFTSQHISTIALTELANHLNLPATINTGLDESRIDAIKNKNFGHLKPIILAEYELYDTQDMSVLEQLKLTKYTPKILLSMMPERGITDTIRQQYAGFLTKPLDVSHLITELIRLSTYDGSDNLSNSKRHSSKVQLSFESFMDGLQESSLETSLKTAPKEGISQQTLLDKPCLPLAKAPLILVAEDNLINQKVIVKILNKLGYRSLIAENGQKALDYLNEQKEDIDLILMDCRMPIMDGLEATRKIRATRNTIPIIALTANDTDADRRECLEEGMNSFLPKPINKKRLEKLLKKFIIHEGM